jgi:hypothetical protein
MPGIAPTESASRAVPAAGIELLKRLDESRITRAHWKILTTGHGVASAAGKVGALVGVFLFPVMLAHRGLAGAEAMAALASVLGLAVTIFMLPETKGRSLEELSELAIAEGVTAR